ncbi:penicillin-binding protein activator [uncultured Porticoccus sp.]|tara:strand:- start:5018 stop:6907 length:1890 start_codon:yes stop_codon:yes gene_type:complete
MFKFRITAMVLLGLVLVLSGCTQTGHDTPKTGPATPLGPAERAEQALSLAANSIAPHRQLHQLDAAEFLVLAGDNQQALKVLSSLDQNALSGQRLVDYRLLFAEVAMGQERFFLARDLLTDPGFTANAGQLPTSLQVKWQKLRGELFSLLGEDEQSIRAYAELSSLVTSTGEQTDISEAIWRLLTHISQKHLAALQATESDPVLQGWYTLASRVRENQGDMDKQLREITDWQIKWPDHPAALNPPPSLTALQEVANNLPEQIAVLLPLQGSLAEAGKAIRGGILSAWYDVRGARGNTPFIRFYDTSSSDDIGPLYQQAINEGAELIIGPVQREKVSQLLDLPELPVPTVALNYLDTPSTEVRQNFFQFGLSSTAEARQVADRAWLEGRRFALAITPDSSSGIRALAAFRERWQERGGTLVEVPAYGVSQSDFIALLKPTLQIEQSIERNGRLQRLLGKQLAHTPRRRQDLDMVFLIAPPNQARQIKPTLDFLFASDLQVYGTSQLFSGIQDPRHNRDLDGVRFSAMPWTLPGYNADSMRPAEDLEPIYRHMFALGIDTYHLHQWLGQMLLFPNIRLPGNTGMLYLTPPDTIDREQPWGVFKNGRVVPAIQLQKKTLEAEQQTASSDQTP